MRKYPYYGKLVVSVNPVRARDRKDCSRSGTNLADSIF